MLANQNTSWGRTLAPIYLEFWDKPETQQVVYHVTDYCRSYV